MSPIAPIGAVSAFTEGLGVAGVTGVSGPGAAGGVTAAAGTDGSGFAATLVSSLEQVQSLQAESSRLAVQAATGDLTDVHDYTIAASEAKVATEVTVAVRNKALEAFNEIMRIQV